MKNIIILTACLRLLSDMAYKLDLVRDVEEVTNPKTGEIEIIHVYERGERPTRDEREKIQQMNTK